MLTGSVARRLPFSAIPPTAGLLYLRLLLLQYYFFRTTIVAGSGHWPHFEVKRNWRKQGTCWPWRPWAFCRWMRLTTEVWKPA